MYNSGGGAVRHLLHVHTGEIIRQPASKFVLDLFLFEMSAARSSHGQTGACYVRVSCVLEGNPNEAILHATPSISDIYAGKWRRLSNTYMVR